MTQLSLHNPLLYILHPRMSPASSRGYTPAGATLVILDGETAGEVIITSGRDAVSSDEKCEGFPRPRK